jgi:hypothetical protein
MGCSSLFDLEVVDMASSDEFRRLTYNCFDDLANIADSGTKFSRILGKRLGKKVAIEVYIVRLAEFVQCATGDLAAHDEVVARVNALVTTLSSAKKIVASEAAKPKAERNPEPFKKKVNGLTKSFTKLTDTLSNLGLPVLRCERLAGSKNEVRGVIWPQKKAA